VPLDPEQQRKVYLYLRVLQVSATGDLLGNVPVLTEATHKLQAAIDSLTAAGATSVVQLLAAMDPLFTRLGTVDTRFQAEQIGTIKTNPKEWQDRITQWEWFRGQLAAALGLALAELEAGAGAVGGIQGPWREP
jgi:ABC-type phosphate transport system substrate-binding protein